jgi:hypothetical protein
VKKLKLLALMLLVFHVKHDLRHGLIERRTPTRCSIPTSGSGKSVGSTSRIASYCDISEDLRIRSPVLIEPRVQETER